MGRRKIEIKAIKDDRNRSVTFLKRKGGLFKKAHELSVLCSVDVAVVIFGQNKKLYEFSSGNMRETLTRYQFYNGPHEHKGPADFADRGGDDDDDEGDDQAASPGPDEQSPPQHGVVFQQPGLQHVRNATPSASPPMANGVYPRRATPQPQNLSRPSSRNHVHPGSNLAPQHHPHPQAHQPPPHLPVHYSYPPQQHYYQAPPQASGPPPPQPPAAHAGMHPNMHMHPNHQNPPPMPQQYSHPAQHTQMQQAYLQEQRRQSMPPNFSMQQQQDRPAPPPPPHQHQQQEQPHHQQPPQQQQHQSPPQVSRPFQSDAMPGSPKLAPPTSNSRTHSIYTPIDDSRSMLAQQWETPHHNEVHARDFQSPAKSDGGFRSQSIDVGSAMRSRVNGGSPERHYHVPPPLARTGNSPPLTGIASAPTTATFPPPSRVNSIASSTDAKRPRLTVQIPSEQDEAEAVENPTAGTSASPKGSGSNPTATPVKQTTGGAGGTGSSGHSRSASVVLPPPSPSANSATASAVLSAGATGPKNPFARPLPPPSGAPGLNTNLNIQYKDAGEAVTPISALPSRFMSDGLLPSPSSFYPDWGFGSASGGNNLASPAPYQPTPIKERADVHWRSDANAANAASFTSGAADPDSERKRKGSAEDAAETHGPAKKLKP